MTKIREKQSPISIYSVGDYTQGLFDIPSEKLTDIIVMLETNVQNFLGET